MTPSPATAADNNNKSNSDGNNSGNDACSNSGSSSSSSSSRLLTRALILCTPTAQETKKITAVAGRVKGLVEARAAALTTKEVADVVFGGSFAKGTWLRGDADIDIFVKVRPDVDEKRFEELGVKIGREALAGFDPQLRYSDHPYVEAFVRGIRVNIVPCYDVEKGKWKSAADRSPYHTQYIMQALGPEKKAQVRLLKKFLKSAGIYGAEISTAGFSGYVSEVLIAKYGSLEGVLRAAAAGFRQGHVIAVDEGRYDPDVARGFSSPLVIIDPVDPRRNLGTAISPESAGRLVLAARAFLKKPSVRFFAGYRPGRVDRHLLGNVLVAEFSHRKRSPDTIWGQLKRSSNSLAKQLEIAGFTVFRHTCQTDEEDRGAFAFLLESLTLPPYIVRKGPEIAMAKETENFIAKSKKKKPPLAVWADREMRVSMVTERNETDAGRLLQKLLQNPQSSGVAKDMIVTAKAKLEIYSGSGRKKMSKVARKAAYELASTESLIFS